MSLKKTSISFKEMFKCYGILQTGSVDDQLSQLAKFVLFKDHFLKEFCHIKRCGGLCRKRILFNTV